MRHLFIAALAGGICLAASAQPKEISIREFRTLPESDTTSYTIGGVIEKFRSTSTRSFYLNDGTASVLIYGIVDGEGQILSSARLPLSIGDSLCVCGRKTIYDRTVVEMKNAVLISCARMEEQAGLVFSGEADGVTPPLFKGKDANTFTPWVNDRLCYPASASAKGLDGKVVLSFSIDTDGKLTDIKVLQGADRALNAEAIRVVRKSPKWTPGKIDGKPVKVTYTFPVYFSTGRDLD